MLSVTAFLDYLQRGADDFLRQLAVGSKHITTFTTFNLRHRLAHVRSAHAQYRSGDNDKSAPTLRVTFDNERQFQLLHNVATVDGRRRQTDSC